MNYYRQIEEPDSHKPLLMISTMFNVMDNYCSANVGPVNHVAVVISQINQGKIYKFPKQNQMLMYIKINSHKDFDKLEFSTLQVNHMSPSNPSQRSDI